MKRIAAIFLSIPILFSALNCGRAAKVFAESYGYARVVADDAVFYADAALLIERFILPKTYFVRIVSIGVESSRVVYMESGSIPAAEGYVKNADLYFTQETPSSPYPDIRLTVEVDEVMFADVSRSQPKCVLSRSVAAHYYGEMTSGGETYLYVYSLGNVGYVKKSSFSDFSIPDHPTYREITPTDSSSDAESTSAEISQEQKSGVTSAQVIIIALLIVGVLCMLFLLLRPEQKNRKSRDYYDDE